MKLLDGGGQRKSKRGGWRRATTAVLGGWDADKQLPGAAPLLLRASDPHTHKNGDHGIPEPDLRKGSPPLGHISYTWEEGDFWY